MAGTYKIWLWPNSAHITYTWHALLLCHTPPYIHIYIYIYRTSLNLYTPDSECLTRVAPSPMNKVIYLLLFPLIWAIQPKASTNKNTHFIPQEDRIPVLLTAGTTWQAVIITTSVRIRSQEVFLGYLAYQ